MSRIHKLWAGLRRPRVWAVVALLSLIGLGVYSTARHLLAQYHFAEAERALESHNLEEARAHLLSCLQTRPDKPEVYFLLARTARRRGEYRLADDYLEKCQRSGGIRSAIELERDLQRAQRGFLDPSLEDFLWAAVKKAHPDAVPILEALTAGYMQTFRLTAAVECLEEWLALRPDDTRALLWRGESLRQLLLTGQSLDDFRRLVELDPNHVQARRNLADTYASLKQFQQALPHFHWLHKRKPEDTDLAVGLARCQIALGQADSARAILEPLLRADPNNVQVLVECAKVELEAPDPTRAEQWLRRAVDLSPNNFDAVYNLVRCLGRAGNTVDLTKWQKRLKDLEADWRRVSELLTKELRQSPKNAALRFEVGKLLLHLGSDKEGLGWLHSALRENPAHQEANEILRRYYRDNGRPDMAALHERALRKAGGTKPDSK